MLHRDMHGSISREGVLFNRLRFFMPAGKDFAKVGSMKISLRIGRGDDVLFQF
jgi:hypothetical protein